VQLAAVPMILIKNIFLTTWSKLKVTAFRCSFTEIAIYQYKKKTCIEVYGFGIHSEIFKGILLTIQGFLPSSSADLKA
jgi:hypothetical protein